MKRKINTKKDVEGAGALIFSSSFRRGAGISWLDINLHLYVLIDLIQCTLH